MRERRWTEGPWDDGRLVGVITTDVNLNLAFVTTGDPERRAECKANAHLIKAAPKLAEALEEAVAWDSHDICGVSAVWLQRALDALAQAYGDDDEQHS